MNIFFFAFHCQHLLSGNEGAYINCWVKSERIHEAEQIAGKLILDAEWNILSKEEGYEITREEYLGRLGGSEYYEQAIIDGWVLVIHSYPK